ncbi:MAG TPA: DNA polymerase I [Saprospiraceae bacterium]|nr:DNA polymerase I [Saprospiraceae bacterium]
MPEKKLFLLDGHALVYRAHFAFITRPLINSKGINTSAITGFVRTLWDLISNQKPTHIAVAFDPPGDTFRHKFFPEYKANREAQPEDIAIAIPYIKRILEGFRIPILEIPDFEADDVIGTLAKQAEKEGFTVFMVTPDKDYGQLVSSNIFMYKPSRQGNGIEILGEKEILESWGINKVNQVIDMLGLQGDSVDNIPGIPGIGPKTATILIQSFGSVESVIENVHQLKGKQQENVSQYADQALLSKKLATIHTEVPIAFNSEEFRIDPMDKDTLEEVFKELEFRTLAHQILGTPTQQLGVQGSLFEEVKVETQRENTVSQYTVVDHNISNVSHQYHYVNTKEKRQELLHILNNSKEIAFDTETTGIDANNAELVGLVFAVKPKEAYYIPCPESQTETQQIVDEFKPVLENKDKVIIGQNIKYDALIMKWYGVDIQGQLFDTMIAHYLCEPDLRHNLNYLAESILGYKMVSIEELIGKKGRNQLSMRDVDDQKVKEYAGEDADITLQLATPLRALLKENQLEKVYEDIDAPLIPVLRDMEFEGVQINPDFLSAYSKDLEKLIIQTEREIYKSAGSDFNIGSPKQVGEILFERLKIPYLWRKTSTGQYSTDVEKLTELSPHHPIVNLILDFRKYSKLKSTYVDALPALINPRTQRVHSHFNQARAATGRLSSENPNLQNIPIKDEAGREIRKAFEPRNEEFVLLAADYSQIELRLIAELSGDEVMMEAFLADKDFHRATAARVYGVTYENVNSEQRRNAKTVNFSITYGAGATNLSRQLGIKRNEAKDLIDQYFTQYSGLKNYMDETVEFARKNGYVSTMLGRRRFLRDINSQSSLMRSNAERMAINTPVQGTAADMIKKAMIGIHQILIKGAFRSKMILQVHDELVFDMHRDELKTLKPLIENEMKTAIPGLKVPIQVGMGIGNNWLEAH